MSIAKVKYKIILLFSLLFLTTSLFSESKLKILNWSEYIDIEILKSYVAKTDTKIEYIIYENNEELMELLNSNKEFDIIFPSSNYIPKLSSDGLISKLEYSQIPNYKNIDPYFLERKSIKNYALPYFWGTTGVLYDNDKIKISSFSDLWKNNLKDKLFILDDMRDMFAISLLSLGYDINTQNEDEIKKAYEKLLKLIPNIKGFYSDSDTLSLDFIKENAYACIVYNGDVYDLVKDDSKNIKFLHPKEGAILWIDTIAIAKKSKNKKQAYDFIDFLISKDISLKNADEIGYALPTKGFETDKAIYPNKKEQKQLKSVIYQEKVENIYEKYWDKFINELKTKGISSEE